MTNLVSTLSSTTLWQRDSEIGVWNAGASTPTLIKSVLKGNILTGTYSKTRPPAITNSNTYVEIVSDIYALAIQDNGTIWSRQVAAVYEYGSPRSDTFRGTTQLGSLKNSLEPYHYDDPPYSVDGSRLRTSGIYMWVYPINNDGDYICDRTNVTSSPSTQPGYYVENLSGEGFFLNNEISVPYFMSPCMSNRDRNGAIRIVHRVNNDLYWWDGSDHLIPNANAFVGTIINAASKIIDGVPVSVPQILGGTKDLYHALWEIDPATGELSAPIKIHDLLNPDSDWSVWSDTINDNSVIGGSGSYTPTNADGSSSGPTEYWNVMLLPAALAVDANRDGLIKFAGNESNTNVADKDVDYTTQEKPFRHWINDDNDSGETDHVGSSTHDYTSDTIVSMRDLEDWTRLWIYTKGLNPAIQAGTIKVGLKWKKIVSGTPGIKVIKATETDGGTAYLTNYVAGTNQAGAPSFRPILKNFIGDQTNIVPIANSAADFVFKQEVWAGLTNDAPNTYFLFESTSEGLGQLVIVFLKEDGTTLLGEGPGVWMDLKNIKKMYERVKATPDSIAAPYIYTSPSGTPPEPTMSCVQDPNGYPFDDSATSWTESKQYIVFVHGWNMSYDGSTNYAETMFKRLWLRGYKGRFAAFRWPTYVGETTYNDSEYIAWKAGESLMQFMASLPEGYTRNLVAHSMGNIVSGSALIKGMSVANYALLNGAVPACCYDDSSSLDQGWGYSTPHYDADETTRNLSYRYKLNSVNANLINFFLPDDDALKKWEWNNDTPSVSGRFLLVGYKPQFFSDENSGFLYAYNPSGQSGQKLNISYIPSGGRLVATPHEAMAYVVQSPTKTVGADGDTGGSIGGSVDMRGYNFNDVHSAEFNFGMQDTTRFYNELLDQLGIPRS